MDKIPTLDDQNWKDFTGPQYGLVQGLLEMSDLEGIVNLTSVSVEERESSLRLRQLVNPDTDFEYQLEEIIVPMEVLTMNEDMWDMNGYRPPVMLTISPGSYGNLVEFDCVYMGEADDETGHWMKFLVTRDSRRPVGQLVMLELRLYAHVDRIEFSELDGLEYVELLDDGDWQEMKICRNVRRSGGRMELEMADAWGGAPGYVIIDIRGDKLIMRSIDEFDYAGQLIETWRPSDRKDVPI